MRIVFELNVLDANTQLSDGRIINILPVLEINFNNMWSITAKHWTRDWMTQSFVGMTTQRTTLLSAPMSHRCVYQCDHDYQRFRCNWRKPKLCSIWQRLSMQLWCVIHVRYSKDKDISVFCFLFSLIWSYMCSNLNIHFMVGIFFSRSLVTDDICACFDRLTLLYFCLSATWEYFNRPVFDHIALHTAKIELEFEWVSATTLFYVMERIKNKFN